MNKVKYKYLYSKWNRDNVVYDYILARDHKPINPWYWVDLYSMNKLASILLGFLWQKQIRKKAVFYYNSAKLELVYTKIFKRLNKSK